MPPWGKVKKEPRNASRVDLLAGDKPPLSPVATLKD